MVFLMAGLLLAGCGRQSTSAADAVAAVDAATGLTRIAIADRVPMPETAGTTIDGHPARVADALGKVVVLNAWASWCAPCRDEIPRLVSAYEASDRSQVAFLGLNVNDDPASAADFASASDIGYPSISDTDGALFNAIPGLASTGLPSTVFLDRQGRVAARIIGPVHDGQVESVLASLEAEA